VIILDRGQAVERWFVGKSSPDRPEPRFDPRADRQKGVPRFNGIMLTRVPPEGPAGNDDPGQRSKSHSARALSRKTSLIAETGPGRRLLSATGDRLLGRSNGYGVLCLGGFRAPLQTALALGAKTKGLAPVTC